MDPITQKLLMASPGSGDAAAPMVEDVFSIEPYMGFGAGYDSPFPSGFNVNYGVDGYYSTYFPGADGNTSYLNGDANNMLNVGSVDFCVEMWVKSKSLGTSMDGNKYYTLWQLHHPDGTGTGNLALQLQPNGSGGGSEQAVRAGNGSYDTGAPGGGTTTVDDGQWHHIALVRKHGVYLKIYVDGNNTLKKKDYYERIEEYLGRVLF